MLDLNKHIVKNDDNKPFHSNGFARIAVGNRVGSVGSMSFSRRQQIDRDRRLVYGYNRSAIGSNYGELRAKPSLQQHNSQPVLVPQRPVSPSPQSYNPFA
jgi:hypothetical protein